MTQSVLGNINISGAGSAGGGQYDSIKISGSGKIVGETVCNEFKVSGSAKVENALDAKVVKISGSAKFMENLNMETINTSGSSIILGNLKGQIAKVSGSSKIEGQVDAEEIHVSGSITVGQDCNTDIFKLSGGCRIGGLLNAGEIEIKIGGHCQIGTIGAENVTVEKGQFKGVLGEMFSSLFGQENILECETIEGDEIFLENTYADMVRGKKIMIGKGCQIKRVEYSDSLEISKDAKVTEQEKI